MYKCCERWKILPPTEISKENRVQISWTDLNIMEQAKLIAYEQIRQIEENKELELIATAGLKKSI